MEKKIIDYEILDKNGEIVGTAVAAEMAAGLTSESIERMYTTISPYKYNDGGFDTIFFFVGLLNSICQDYIHHLHLKPGDPQYMQIVKNLAALSGLTNDDYCLNVDEMQYCIENSLIPVIIDALFAEVDTTEPVRFISKRRFDDIIRLASMITGNYEIPDDPENPRQINMDGFMNLLLCGRETCIQVYDIRKRIADDLALKKRENHIKNTENDTLDFDL